MRVNDLVVTGSGNFEVEILCGGTVLYSGGISEIEGDLLTCHVYSIRINKSSGILYVDI